MEKAVEIIMWECNECGNQFNNKKDAEDCFDEDVLGKDESEAEDGTIKDSIF